MKAFFASREYLRSFAVRLIRKIRNSLNFNPNSKIALNLVYRMASTGEGTKACLEKGCLPVLVHYYQPIPDLKVLEERKVWEKVSKLNGIDFNHQQFKQNLISLSKYADECKWPEEHTSNPKDFYLNNNCFSYGCASVLHSMIRRNKPSRIIEVGSGFSSRIIREAILLNEKDGLKTEYTIIDPYSNLVQEDFPSNTTIIKRPVELMDTAFFEKLIENDILFIDSSHVCKIGSDVNFEILEVLPILNPGVFIHFHDIDLPYEYPKLYTTNPQFRMFWTESYLLQAYLSGNKNYEIFLPMRYMQSKYEPDFRSLFPNGNKIQNWNSGSFWIKRIN